MAFHYAKVETSTRLQGVLSCISNAGQIGASPHDIFSSTGTTNPTGAISELKRNGYRFDKVFCGRTAKGRPINRYVLVARVQEGEVATA